MEATTLANFLSDVPMQSVIGTPLGTARGFYLDIVLSSSDAAVRLSGVAFDLLDRTEAFVLSASDFDPTQKWIGFEGMPDWEVEDLMASLSDSRHSGIWLDSRMVRYFIDPEDRERGLTAQGPFDSAAAIEVGPASGKVGQRVVIYATYEYPCAVELATTSERCDAILARLEEVAPRITEMNIDTEE